jgi:2-oxoglutarate ferredoxin oxidoreductase subunit delta
MAKSGVKGKIRINGALCKGCSLCVSFCPHKSIRLSEKVNESGYNIARFEEESDCNGCAVCALVCPEAAIEVYRD